MVRYEFLKSFLFTPLSLVFNHGSSIQAEQVEPNPMWRTLLILRGSTWVPAAFADAKIGDWVIIVNPDGSIPVLCARKVIRIVQIVPIMGDDFGIECNNCIHLDLPIC